MVFTLFWDMHSGGGSKEPYSEIYIEAKEGEARVIFYNRFGHNPERVSCTCCGEDYSIKESPTLQQASGFHRGCRYAYFDKNGQEVPQEKAWVSGKGLVNGCSERYVEEPDKRELSWHKYKPLDEYLKEKHVLAIYSKDIKPKERKGSVPKQGYVWKE